MKKSLFALAAVGAFAGAAQAQSSVTVYGVLDVGYVGGNERLASSNQQKATFNGFGASAQSTSRLGFRGTEDLGGGTRAFFTLETQLQPQNGTFSSLQTRQAFVGLGQKGVGQGAIGTQNTVITDAVGPTNTGELNNIAGSMIFASRTGPTTISDSTLSTFNGNRNGNTEGFTFRTASTLKLTSDRFAGFQASAMYVWNDFNRTVTTATGTGENNQNGWGLGLNYQWQKLVVTAAYMSLKSVQNNNTGTPVPYALSGQSGSAAALGQGTTDSVRIGGVAGGFNVKDNQTYVGAAYDFGILKAYAGWVNRKVTSQINVNQFASRSAQEIGVRGNLTKTVQSWASIGTGRFQAFGAGEPTANILGWQVGTNYILSKRTNLYAIYGQNGTSSTTNNARTGNNAYNMSNYAVGVRHTF